jgi:hypothetical protein
MSKNNGPILNDNPAVVIEAVRVVKGDKASLFNCEGDEVWIPNSLHSYNESEQELTIEQWFYNKLVTEGKL